MEPSWRCSSPRVAAGGDPPDRRRPRRQLAGGPGPGPPDPARDDAGQEPGGARAPAAVHRPDAAPARGPAVGHDMARWPRTSFTQTDREAPRARGQPGRPARRPTGSASRRSARSSAARVLLPASRLGILGLPIIVRLAMIFVGAPGRLHRSRSSGSAARQEAPEGDPAPDPGRPGPADDLRPRRPRLRRGPGQGRREAQGAPHRGVPPGARRDPGRQGRAATRCGTSSRAPRSRPLTNFIGAIIQAEQLGVSISQGAPGPVRAAPDRAPPARRGDGGQGADQDAVPAGRVHLPVAVHRHPGPGDHPDHASNLSDPGVGG